MVIDKAYTNFYKLGSSAVSLVAKSVDICIMQTLSKSFSLAAIRCISHPYFLSLCFSCILCSTLWHLIPLLHGRAASSMSCQDPVGAMLGTEWSWSAQCHMTLVLLIVFPFLSSFSCPPCIALCLEFDNKALFKLNDLHPHILYFTRNWLSPSIIRATFWCVLMTLRWLP